MDVDTSRKSRPVPTRGCYRCGDPSHLVKDCPVRLDVRLLTADQRAEFMEDLLAIEDAVEEEDDEEDEDFA